MLAKAHWEDRSGEQPVKYIPGDEIPDDHPKREWLLRSKIAVAEPTSEPDVSVVPDGDSDAPSDGSASVPDDDPAPASTSGGKPKPTDSIEKHREYATKVGIDPKGLSRAQLIKAIKDK